MNEKLNKLIYSIKNRYIFPVIRSIQLRKRYKELVAEAEEAKGLIPASQVFIDWKYDEDEQQITKISTLAIPDTYIKVPVYRDRKTGMFRKYK